MLEVGLCHKEEKQRLWTTSYKVNHYIMYEVTENNYLRGFKSSKNETLPRIWQTQFLKTETKRQTRHAVLLATTILLLYEIYLMELGFCVALDC